MSKRLVIYGAGGLGKEVLSLLRALPEWEVAGFYDDGLKQGTVVKGNLKVLGGMKELVASNLETYVVLAFGSPASKQRLATSLKSNAWLKFPTLIHPSAILQDEQSIAVGAGSIIGAGCVLTTDIEVGDHVLINLNCTVGHDVKIGNFSSLMPGVNISGEVKIDEGVLVGAGANIINQLTIGNGATIGAGSVVTKSIPAGSTAVGVPSRIIKTGQ